VPVSLLRKIEKALFIVVDLLCNDMRVCVYPFITNPRQYKLDNHFSFLPNSSFVFFISISNLISKAEIDRMFKGTDTNYLFREKGSFVTVSIIAFFIFIFFDVVLCIH
jgi:hypothetical protein